MGRSGRSNGEYYAEKREYSEDGRVSTLVMVSTSVVVAGVGNLGKWRRELIQL